jgi:hypothetical protein
MPQNDVATLSLAGYLKTPGEKADALMAHAQASDKSQTALYGTAVTSLAWLFDRYSADLGKLADEIRKAYSDLFSRHFDNVEVTTGLDNSTTEDENRFVLRMYISFSQDGKNYNVGNLLHGLNGKYAGTVKIKEYGVTS